MSTSGWARGSLKTIVPAGYRIFWRRRKRKRKANSWTGLLIRLTPTQYREMLGCTIDGAVWQKEVRATTAWMKWNRLRSRNELCFRWDIGVNKLVEALTKASISQQPEVHDLHWLPFKGRIIIFKILV